MWFRFEAVDPRTECRCASQGSSARRRRRQPSAAGRWVLHVSECACVPRVVRGIAVSASRIERTNTRPHTSLRSRRAERTVSRPVRFAPFYRVVRVWTRLPRLHELPGVSATTEQGADAFGTDALSTAVEESPLRRFRNPQFRLVDSRPSVSVATTGDRPSFSPSAGSCLRVC